MACCIRDDFERLKDLRSWLAWVCRLHDQYKQNSMCKSHHSISLLLLLLLRPNAEQPLAGLCSACRLTPAAVSALHVACVVAYAPSGTATSAAASTLAEQAALLVGSSPDSIVVNRSDIRHKNFQTLLWLLLRFISHEPVLLVTGDDVDDNAIRLADGSLQRTHAQIQHENLTPESRTVGLGVQLGALHRITS